jgi:hypothetical protein
MFSNEGSERCFTVNISRNGACVEIRQLLRLGQTITLEKENTREPARATVAWTKVTGRERFLTGLQIVDKEDFWGFGPVEKKQECGTSEAIE